MEGGETKKPSAYRVNIFSQTDIKQRKKAELLSRAKFTFLRVVESQVSVDGDQFL